MQTVEERIPVNVNAGVLVAIGTEAVRILGLPLSDLDQFVDQPAHRDHASRYTHFFFICLAHGWFWIRTGAYGLFHSRICNAVVRAVAKTSSSDRFNSACFIVGTFNSCLALYRPLPDHEKRSLGRHRSSAIAILATANGV